MQHRKSVSTYHFWSADSSIGRVSRDFLIMSPLQTVPKTELCRVAGQVLRNAPVCSLAHLTSKLTFPRASHPDILVEEYPSWGGSTPQWVSNLWLRGSVPSLPSSAQPHSLFPSRIQQTTLCHFCKVPPFLLLRRQADSSPLTGEGSHWTNTASHRHYGDLWVTATLSADAHGLVASTAGVTWRLHRCPFLALL